MTAAAKVKSAARKLSLRDRADLFGELAKDVAVQKDQLKRLRAAIDIGDRDLAEGRYTEISTDADLRAFFADRNRREPARLKRSA